MKKTIIIFLLTLIIWPWSAKAQESEVVEYCFTIDNLNKYPAYYLLLFSDGPTYSYQLIDEESNRCLSSKKHSRSLLLAIEREGFDSDDFASNFAEFKRSDKFTVEERDQLIDDINKRVFKISLDDANFFNPYNRGMVMSDFYNDPQAVKDFAIEYLVNEDFYQFFRDQGFIFSDFRLDSRLSLDFRPGAQKIVDRARITKLNDKVLEMEMTNSEFVYSDGSAESVDYQKISPRPEKKYDIWQYWPAAGAVLLVLLVGIIYLFKKKHIKYDNRGES